MGEQPKGSAVGSECLDLKATLLYNMGFSVMIVVLAGKAKFEIFVG